ncbi:hypothetical protein NQ318_006383 [Aromia moschata]|uniref:HMG box domain-containing protein n=1 Tax=Aromia moschata TaxID=1265417 RepID=A0AAV8YJC8_9CUCU|nr:hypothetical protein NQ318_006383 [Aromia moschata]
MLDFKNRQGRSFKSMEEVSTAAGPHWARMTKEQRRPYEEKALMEKNNMRVSKYTSEGLDVEILEKQEREEQKKVEKMKEEINEELKMASRAGRVQNKTFFLIHINTFLLLSS